MKISCIITVLLIILISFEVNAQQKDSVNANGYNKFYYPNGVVSSEGTMRDGKPDGYWKTFNENGIMVSEGNRKNFELDSTWRFYDNDGKIAMEVNYKLGKKDGIRRIYRQDEIIEENFKADVKEGITRYMTPNRRVTKEVFFKDGLEDGVAKEYGDDGRIITLITYKNGFITDREMINRYDNNDMKNGLWKYFYPNGMVQREGYYQHGVENGYFKEYDMDGNLLTTEKFAQGVKLQDVAELVKLDVRKDYYPDGKVKIAATYNKEGNLEGIRREYAEDGTVDKSYIFRNGIMIGEGIVTEKGERDGFWKEYYDDGTLRAEGKYNKDKKEGFWKFYQKNGVVEQEGNYKNGLPDGEWRWYYASEELLRDENYYDGLQDGLSTEYDEEGNVITKGEYIEGKENGEWVYKSPNSEIDGTYADGMRNGLWQYWDVSETPGKPKVLRFEGRFIEDNPHGEHTYYWDNGNRKEQGEYEMGKKIGNWTYYNYDGTPFIVVTYENGTETRYDGINIVDTRENPEEK